MPALPVVEAKWWDVGYRLGIPYQCFAFTEEQAERTYYWWLHNPVESEYIRVRPLGS